MKVFILLSLMLVLTVFSFETNQNIQTIKTPEYTIYFSYENKSATKVVCNLVGVLVDYKNIKKRPSFLIDQNIPKEYQTRTSDYTNNIYNMDRGHMCSDASFDYSQESLQRVYLMSNIVPQHKKLNRGTWKTLEEYSRQKALKFGKVKVTNIIHFSQFKIKGISVPSKFIKILEYNNYKECFEFLNEAPQSEDIFDYHINCKGLE